MTPSVQRYKQQLNNHPLLSGGVIQTLSDLRIFMEYHVYAVWDFMSLAKAVQHLVCPSGGIWYPTEIQRKLGRDINAMILCEESDTHPELGAISHFDLYVAAMREIGADTTTVNRFIAALQNNKKYSLNQLLLNIPSVSRQFCNDTFEVIATEQPHIIAATFAHGRETIIPTMFQRLVDTIDFGSYNAHYLEFYLQRHIEVDGDEHGDSAQLLCNHFITTNEQQEQAEQAAIDSINSRIRLWDRVADTIQKVRELRQ